MDQPATSAPAGSTSEPFLDAATADVEEYARALLNGAPDAEFRAAHLANTLAHAARLDADLAAARADHVTRDVWSCGMRSVGEVETLHSSGNAYPAVLVCTLDAGHGGPHIDLNHCWTRHTFTAAEPGTRLDRRTCSCGHRLDNCQTTHLLDTLGIPAHIARPEGATAAA